MINLGTVIQEYFEDTKGSLIDQYDSLGLRASGKYAESLLVTVEEEETKIRATIQGAEHVIWMEEGRGPNKRQDRGMIAFVYVKILEWMKVKGVSNINPWMTAKRIVEEGIKVPNPNNKGGVISGVINEEWLDDLQETVIDTQNTNYMEAVIRLMTKQTVKL